MALPPSDAEAVQVRSKANWGVVSGAGVAVSAVGVSGTAATLLVMEVAARARLPLPAVSSTASAASSTVSGGEVTKTSPIRSSSTVVPFTLPSLVSTVVVVPAIRRVILLRSSELTLSLNVRMIFEPLVEVLGALEPVVTRVGRMASTLCPDWSPTAS